MGIYISDLEISKDKAVRVVIIRDDGICVDEWGNTYEVVSLQPHGRLIDAAVLEQDAQKRLSMCNKNDNQFQKPYEVMRAIELAPTIIEAEPPSGCKDCKYWDGERCANSNRNDCHNSILWWPKERRE